MYVAYIMIKSALSQYTVGMSGTRGRIIIEPGSIIEPSQLICTSLALLTSTCYCLLILPLEVQIEIGPVFRCYQMSDRYNNAIVLATHCRVLAMPDSTYWTSYSAVYKQPKDHGLSYNINTASLIHATYYYYRPKVHVQIPIQTGC